MFRKKGFTLLELIIVIVVIGILASLALPRYLKVAEKGRATEGKRAMGLIRSAQITYNALYGTYSTVLGTNGLELCMTLTYFNAPDIAGTLNETYLGKVVRNTKDAGSYAYTITASIAALCCTGSANSCVDIGPW